MKLGSNWELQEVASTCLHVELLSHKYVLLTSFLAGFGQVSLVVTTTYKYDGGCTSYLFKESKTDPKLFLLIVTTKGSKI